MIETLKYRFSMLLAAALVVGVAGCSTLEKVGLGKGASGKNAATTESVYYTDSAELPLYRNSGGRDVISKLPPNTKVIRDHLQKGYAHVRVESTGEKGWVENNKLIWRVPEEVSSPQAAEAMSPPATPPATPTAAAVPQAVTPQEVPAAQVLPPAAPPSPAAVKSSPAASSPSGTPAVPPSSIFNPY